MKKIAIAFIGTNKYASLFNDFYRSVNRLFLPECKKTILFFTNTKPNDLPSDVVVIPIDHKSWPFVTLERFESILKAEKIIEQNDWFVYFDADMLVNAPISYNEFFNEEKDWFGVQHSGFVNKLGTFEYRKKSTAALDPKIDDLSIYWQGCLWGGKTKPVIHLCKVLSENVATDLKNDIIAIWHDESHLNKFYSKNKKNVHTLEPSHAYPERFSLPYPKRILHIHKDNDELRS